MVGTPAPAGNPTNLEAFFRSSIIRSERIVVGVLLEVNAFKETTGERSGTICIEKTLWGTTDTENYLTVHWCANQWKTPEGNRIQVADGDTQLGVFVGRRILWGLLSAKSRGGVSGLRCTFSPICLDEKTDQDLVELAMWAENPDTTKSYVAVIHNIFKDLEVSECSSEKIRSVADYFREEAKKRK